VLGPQHINRHRLSASTYDQATNRNTKSGAVAMRHHEHASSCFAGRGVKKESHAAIGAQGIAGKAGRPGR